MVYKRDNAESEISIHLDLILRCQKKLSKTTPEEVGRSLHVEPGLPRNGPQHDVPADVQLIPQGAVEVPNMMQIISKGVQTGCRLEQRVLFFRQGQGGGNLRDLF